ncbi:MAG: hypothetical protein CL862_00930 [Cyanobium sp. NAT70]|nr:hypothetical protein [Cyanobium sp. NAT70]
MVDWGVHFVFSKPSLMELLSYRLDQISVSTTRQALCLERLFDQAALCKCLERGCHHSDYHPC